MKQFLLTLIILISTLSSCTKNNDQLPDNGLPTTGKGLKSLNIGLEHFEADLIQPLLLNKSTVILQLRGQDYATIKLNAMIERHSDNGGHLRVEDPQLTQLPLQKYHLTSITYFRNDISNPTKGGSTMDTLFVGLGIDITNPNDIKITNSYNNATGAYGEGTEDDPIVISNADQFDSLLLGPLDSLSFEGVHFLLAMDEVTLNSAKISSGSSYWLPAGISFDVNGAPHYVPFCGTLDGAGCNISGVSSQNQQFSGLFYSLKNATIKNLNMKVDLASASNVGSLAYKSINSTIDNVTVAGTIKCDGRGGGFFAEAYGTTMRNCHSRASIKYFTTAAYDMEHIGGFVGKAGSLTLEKCSRDNSIDVPNCTYVGGFIGTADVDYNNGIKGDVILDNLTLNGNITASTNVGGVIGSSYKMNIKASNVYLGVNFSDKSTFYEDLPKIVDSDFSKVEINGKNIIGGFAGRTNCDIVSISTFKAPNHENVILSKKVDEGLNDGAGGMIGDVHNIHNLTINTATISGNISGSSCGGLIGLCKSVDNLTLEGKIEIKDVIIGGSNMAHAGGMVGYAYLVKYITTKNSSTLLSGCTISANKAVGGLFGYCLSSTADMPNLGMRNLTVSGEAHVGGVMGYADIVELLNFNSKSDNENIKLSKTGSTGSIGGLVGCGMAMRIENCTLGPAVTITSTLTSGGVGGIIGSLGGTNKSRVVNSRVDRGASISGHRAVGGIVGQSESAYDAYITKCVNLGTVKSLSTDNYGFGGVLGTTFGKVYISQSGNKGSVTGCYETGGIVGTVNNKSYNETRITECYNEGVIDGNKFVGGLVGIAREDMTMQNCYNAVPIANGNSAGHQYVGGLVGFYTDLNNTNELHYCFNTSPSGFGTVGGVNTDSDEDKISSQHTYYANNGGDYEYKNNHTYGIPMDKERLTDQSAFSGYDFNSIWKMGGSHPELRNANY